MPLRNPFHRQDDAPSLRGRAADLKAGLARVIRKPSPPHAAEPEAKGSDSFEDFATIEFAPSALDFPVKAPQEWVSRFGEHALAMHIADRTVRMTKPELIAFIRESGEQDAETPTAIFHSLDGAQETFEGWGNLLKLARARYIVAASAACLEPNAGDEAAPVELPPAAPPAEPATLAPSDLADACLWAVQHRAWIDHELAGENDWPDERFEAESGKVNAVFTRAISEPSADLHQIAAKATLALEDFERFKIYSIPGQEIDDGDRIVQTVLREIAAFTGEADEAAPLEIRGPDLVGLIDLSSATMEELRATSETADELGTAAHAQAWMGRSKVRGSDWDLNSAGRLAQWVGDALIEVVSAVIHEARGRAPATDDDRRIRFEILARSIVQNGEPAETVAFARELLAYAEDERERG